MLTSVTNGQVSPLLLYKTLKGNGNHVIPPSAQKQVTMLTLVTVQMVTMLYPLRPKTGDHAYFGYLFTLVIKNFKIKWSPCKAPSTIKIGDHAYFAYQESGLFSLFT